MKSNLWKIYLAGVVAVAASYFVYGSPGVSKLVLYNGIALSAVVAVLYGIRRNQPANKTAWFFIAAAMASFLTADIVYYVLELTSPIGEAPFPSIADGFYLSMYPLMIVGLLKLLRSVSPGRDVAEHPRRRTRRRRHVLRPRQSCTWTATCRPTGTFSVV